MHAEDNKLKRKLSKTSSKPHSPCKKAKTSVKKTKELFKSQQLKYQDNNENKINTDNEKSIAMTTNENIESKDCCVITVDTLKDGVRVLIPKEGLFYQGRVGTVSPPDL